MKIKLPQMFLGQTVTIVGGGPSLEGFNFSRIRQPAITINSSFMKCDSYCLVSMDPLWEKTYSHELESYNGVKVSYTGRNMQNFHEVELDADPEPFGEDWCILKANLSGFFAVSLAFHLGGDKVVLLGFDGGYSGKDPNHYENVSQGVTPESYTKANAYYDFFLKDHRNDILNVGMNSLITSFKKAPLAMEFYELI